MTQREIDLMIRVRDRKVQLEKLFEDTEITMEFGDECITFFREDGLSCEFYGDTEYSYLTATYTLDLDRPEELFFELPYEIQSLKIVIMQILGLSRIKAEARSVK